MRFNIPETSSNDANENMALMAEAFGVVAQIREARTAMIQKHGANYKELILPYLRLLAQAAAVPDMHGNPLLATIGLLKSKPDWADRQMVLASLAEWEVQERLSKISNN